MNELHFEPRIEGEFVYEKDENGNDTKVIKEIKNMKFISIDVMFGTIFGRNNRKT